MENIKVYNKDGNVAGEITAPEFLLAPWKNSLVHQVFKALSVNRRRPIAHTKDRSEVRGGGRKPWKQKGTGRARHGSIRSPLWRHGGVTFGPRKTTDFSQEINKKMAKQALQSVLAKKNSLGQFKIINNLAAVSPKTKELARTVRNLTEGRSAVVVTTNEDANTLRAAANLKNVTGKRAKDLNLYDVVTHKYVLIDQRALNQLQTKNVRK